ncbi:hypothetical protein Illi2_00181 [Pseudomonas phage vB_PpuM-Illi-2]
MKNVSRKAWWLIIWSAYYAVLSLIILFACGWSMLQGVVFPMSVAWVCVTACPLFIPRIGNYLGVTPLTGDKS